MKLNILLVLITFCASVHCAAKWRYTNKLTYLANCHKINNYTIVVNDINLKVGIDGDTFINGNFTVSEDVESLQVIAEDIACSFDTGLDCKDKTVYFVPSVCTMVLNRDTEYNRLLTERITPTIRCPIKKDFYTAKDLRVLWYNNQGSPKHNIKLKFHTGRRLIGCFEAHFMITPTNRGRRQKTSGLLNNQLLLM